MPPAFVERKDKKVVENAGRDTLGQALGPTNRTPYILSSAPRAGQDAALLQKRETGKREQY